MIICSNTRCKKCTFLVNGKCALIDGVEQAIDCGYDVPEEHLKIYDDLIEKRREINEMQSIKQ